MVRHLSLLVSSSYFHFLSLLCVNSAPKWLFTISFFPLSNFCQRKYVTTPSVLQNVKCSKRDQSSNRLILSLTRKFAMLLVFSVLSRMIDESTLSNFIIEHYNPF